MRSWRFDLRSLAWSAVSFAVLDRLIDVGGGVGDHRVDHRLHVDALFLGDLGDRLVALQLRSQVVDTQVQRLGGGVEPGAVPAGRPVGLGRRPVAAGLGTGHGRDTEDPAAGEARRQRGRGKGPRGPELGAHENSLLSGGGYRGAVSGAGLNGS